jgi:uncharacterized protein (DUF2141 family)
MKFLRRLPIGLPVFVIAAVMCASHRPANSCTLEIRIKGAENADGNMSLLLFNSKTGFPSDASKAYKNSVVKASGSYQSVVFENLPIGTYAVAVMHDQNGNGQLDTNLFGIPQEGIGVSNNALNTFGPPIFEETSFSLNEQRKVIEITLDYW